MHLEAVLPNKVIDTSLCFALIPHPFRIASLIVVTQVGTKLDRPNNQSLFLSFCVSVLFLFHFTSCFLCLTSFISITVFFILMLILIVQSLSVTLTEIHFCGKSCEHKNQEFANLSHCQTQN